MSSFKNIEGQVFGELLVLKRTNPIESKKTTCAFWLCRCNCGKEVILTSDKVKRNRTCGCGINKYRGLVGQRYNNVTIIGSVFEPPRTNKIKCVCDCGKEFVCVASRVISGHMKSCGCEKNKPHHTTHGLSHDMAYGTWESMRERCRNRPSYIKKGITVCDEWSDFSNFKQWLDENGWEPGLQKSIDRIDNCGPYAPWNCRITTPKVQANNTSKNRTITLCGETKTLSQWAEAYNLRPGIISKRLKRGWPE